MGFYDPNPKEQSFISDMHLEAARLFGTEVTIELIHTTDLNDQHDPSHTFEPPETLDIILDERPDQKLLRSLNWYNEDEEIQPIIAYISKEDNDNVNLEIINGIELELPYDINGSTGTRKYEIGKVQANQPGPLYWICQLVPVREEDDYASEVESNTDQDSKFTYLKVDEEKDAIHDIE